MKKLIFSTVITGLLISACGTTKESANIMADTTLNTRNNMDSTLPYQDADRTRGSVSPGSEENNGGNRLPERQDTLVKHSQEKNISGH